ncbi:hypothetical protein cand_019600 [Cryptosporidium andersoni]|uniref:Uncharacterized protein n=1 Tax=Cryptosporidium andersoni TaxID=117008 RepID=A0A1J4MSN3_9CRYT|nr:hypothetical protein cand_019600 [Cryptosporidium andersoni]
MSSRIPTLKRSNTIKRIMVNSSSCTKNTSRNENIRGDSFTSNNNSTNARICIKNDSCISLRSPLTSNANVSFGTSHDTDSKLNKSIYLKENRDNNQEVKTKVELVSKEKTVKLPRVALMTKGPKKLAANKEINDKNEMRTISSELKSLNNISKSITKKVNKASTNSLNSKCSLKLPKSSKIAYNNPPLSIRQKNLIREREEKLSRSKKLLEEREHSYKEELMLVKTMNSELLLAEENFQEQKKILKEERLKLEKQRQQYSEYEIESMNEIEKKLAIIQSLEEGLHKTKISNKEFSDKIEEIKHEIKFLNSEILACEKSIQLCKLDNKGGGKLVDKLKYPFKKSIKYTLELEKSFLNDKLIINQLQYRIHKYKKQPRYVCRIYSQEIPTTAKIFISIPNAPNEIDSEIKEDVKFIDSSEEQILERKFPYFTYSEQDQCINISNRDISINIDKVVNFDETSRPTSLLMTDLDTIQDLLTNTIEGFHLNDDETLNMDIGLSQEEFPFVQERKTKSSMLRRQSLLHTTALNNLDEFEHSKDKIEILKLEIPNQNYGINLNSKENINQLYCIDLNEQKDIEMDILLMVNDIFNSIRLNLGDKSYITKDTNQTKIDVESICFINIGGNNTASRLTFWGKKESRCISNMSNKSNSKNFLLFNNCPDNSIEMPGILHSVIHQLFQNMKSISFIKWELQLDLGIQPIINYKLDISSEIFTTDDNSQDALLLNNYIRSHQSNNILQETKHSSPIKFPGGLSGHTHLEHIYNKLDECDINSESDEYSREEKTFFLKLSTRSFDNPDELLNYIYDSINKLDFNYLAELDVASGSISNSKKESHINCNILSSNSIEDGCNSAIKKSLHIVLNFKLIATLKDKELRVNFTMLDLSTSDQDEIDNDIQSILDLLNGRYSKSSITNFISDLFIQEGQFQLPLTYVLFHSLKV